MKLINLIGWCTFLFWLTARPETVFAQSKADSLTQLLNEAPSDTAKIALYKKLIKEYQTLDRSKAIPVAYAMLDLARQMGSEKDMGYAMYNLGSDYLYLSQNDSSLYFLVESNKIYTQLGNTEQVNANLSNMALIYQRTNQYEKATETYYQVINSCREEEDHYCVCATLVNLASIFIDQEDYLQARNNLLLIPTEYAHTKEPKVRQDIETLFPAVYINLGQSFREDSKLPPARIDSALHYYNLALTATQKLPDEFVRNYYSSYVYQHLGDTYLAKENLGQGLKDVDYVNNALSSFRSSLEGFIAISDPRGQTFSLNSIGKLLNKQKKYPEARQTLEEALTLAQKLNFQEELRDVYAYLAENARGLGRHQEAYDFYQLHVAYKDSIRNSERDAVVNRYQVQFETAEKERQILEQQHKLALAKQKQTTSTLIYIGSLLAIIGGVLLLYSRYRYRQQKKAAEYEKAVNLAMSRFVPNEFIKALGRDKVLDVQLGDQVEKQVTVMFSDIRNFTTLSEAMTPAENFRFVKEYVLRMGPIIQRNHGFINQYIGDGIMAIFQREPADAVRACIEMQQEIDRYNAESASKGLPDIKVGMGLHSGPLVMGIIGDEERRDAAIIADTVNTTSRIESTTKDYGSKIIVSGQVIKGLDGQHDFHFRFVGQLTMKGKSIPIEVYECFDADETYYFQKKKETKPAFEQGVRQAILRNDGQENENLASVLAAFPEDKIARMLTDK